LGRRLLLQCEQRRPDAGVEVYGECNTNTNTYSNTNTNAYTYSNAEANSNAEAAPDSISSPDSASLREMVIGGQSTVFAKSPNRQKRRVERPPKKHGEPRSQRRLNASACLHPAVAWQVHRNGLQQTFR
jgi:hypothetical protein